MTAGPLRRHLPNALTLARVAAVPMLAAAFFAAEPWRSWLALALFAAAALTDYLDGWLARRWHVVSGFGTFLDPIADKLMVGAVLVLLAWDGRLPGPHIVAAVVILVREIFISGLREFLAGVQIAVPVTGLAKWKTTVQLAAVAVLLAAPAVLPGSSVSLWLDRVGLGLLWLAAWMTAVSGWHYTRAAWPVIAGRHPTGTDGRSGDETNGEAR